MLENYAVNIAIERAPAYLWSNIQWGWVLFLTFFSFILGAFWHQRFHILGRIWSHENYPQGFPEKRSMNLRLMFGSSALGHFILLTTLSAIVSRHGNSLGLTIGLGISVVFVLATMAPTYFFAGRSWKLLAVDAGFYVVLLGLAGAILGNR